MNTAHDPADAQLRALHAQACAALPADTLQQLRQRRHAATRPRPTRRPWTLGLAGASCALVMATVIGLHLQDPANQTPTPTAPGMTMAQQEDPGDLLDENPDFYLWLASDASLAME